MGWQGEVLTLDARVAQDLVPLAALGRVCVLGAEEEELLVPRVAEDEVRPVLRDVLLRPSVWLLAVVLVASELRYILPGDGRTLT